MIQFLLELIPYKLRYINIFIYIVSILPSSLKKKNIYKQKYFGLNNTQYNTIILHRYVCAELV